jgi:hypothetical protein
MPSGLNPQPSTIVLPHAHPISSAHFTLREDGSIAPQSSAGVSPAQPTAPTTGRRDACPTLNFSSDTPFARLYCGNSLELLDAIFADPPYFFSNPESFRGCQRVLKPNGTIWEN